jgi:hypothetical protein
MQLDPCCCCRCLVTRTQLSALLAHAESDWHFDSFALADATAGRPLSTLAYCLMKRNGLTARVSAA